MLQLTFIVISLLLVNQCGAQPACVSNADAPACTATLYVPNKCTNGKCECAAGLTPNTAGDACELKAPTIKDDTTKKYYTNEEYKLECSTSVSGVTFKWYKGAVVVTGATSSIYTIKETTETSAIKYNCEITISGNAAVSNQVSVTVVAPGKICGADSDCTGTGFTGKCDLTGTKRCVCAANYVTKEDTCKNGAAVVNTSLLVLVGAILSKLLKLV